MKNEIKNILVDFINENIEFGFDGNIIIDEDKINFTINLNKFSCNSNLPLNEIKEKILKFIKTL